MASYVINFGNHPTTPTELPEVFTSMTKALLRFDTLLALYKRVTLHRLNFDKEGVVESRSLLKSQGTPVAGFTKVKIPVAKVWFSESCENWCWLCEHNTLGLRGLGDLASSAVNEFIATLKREAGSSDLPVNLLEFEGEFFYGRKGKK